MLGASPRLASANTCGASLMRGCAVLERPCRAAPTPLPEAPCTSSAGCMRAYVAQRGRPSVLAGAASGKRPMQELPSGLLVPAKAAAAVSEPAPARAARRQDESFSPEDSPYIYIDGQRAHSIHPQGKEVIESLGPWAQTDLLRLLKPVDKSWQPQDLLPDASSPDFLDQVKELRAAAAELPTDYLVVLVGDMVTEEALPSYMGMLNRLDGCSDETGAQATPWAQWTRGWTAEENRHGDLLNKYLYLTGKVNMRAVEVTIQNLISHGLDPKLENNPYLCFVYTSFQERATKISHANTARLASLYGDSALTRVCGLIAADEGRHETAYTNIVEQLFHRDPEGATLAFADMMRKGIVMPAHYMEDDWHSSQGNPGQNLFVDYATVADAIGVYTTGDYADIVQHLVQRWNVPELRLSGRAAEAQEYLCKHSERIRRLADLQMERRLRERKRGKSKTASFSWVFNREVSLL